ncbi:hypothetical protein QBC43DRAFT_374411 [Cladorrhinum sp. PSN259]|nr:hypothetical protein QBC43DRAFT_374411 [Cladorrhinum sp. PSN259]
MSLAKAVLNKDVFEKIEQRLAHSVQVLSFIYQIYTLHPQVKEVGLVAAPSEANQIVKSRGTTSQPPGKLDDSNIWLRYSSQEFRRTAWNIGLASLTGVIEVELLRSVQSDTVAASLQTDGKLKSPNEQPAYVRVRLLTWLSHRVLESVIRQAQCGWKHYFRTRNIFQPGDDRWQRAMENILNLDSSALRRQLDRREYALLWSRFDTCNLLLDFGAQTPSSDASTPEIITTNFVPSLNVRFISQRLAWTDKEYYNNNLAELKMRLAIYLALSVIDTKSRVDLISSDLYEKGKSCESQ